MLETRNLSVKIIGDEPKIVIHGVSINVKPGELHAVMGPNGSGKSSLLFAIMGHPRYHVVEGDIRLDGESILKLPTEERSLKGLFLSFQYPVDIIGVRLSTLMIASHNKRMGIGDLLKIEDSSIIKDIRGLIRSVGLSPAFLRRDVNVGFSGGERKKSELFQALFLKPKYILMDEPDTGLDIDGVKLVAKHISSLIDGGSGILLVTHYARILNHVEPDRVSILVGGRIVDSGGPELAQLIDREGYRRYGVVEA